MRQIKFRAWDVENKRFRDSSVAFAVGEISSRANEAGYELQQYIGLKDKNGKEIYEGDIVTIDYIQERVGSHGGKWDYVGHRIGEVIRHESGSYQLKDRESTRVWSFEPETRTIIGNIYENPELLAPQKEKETPYVYKKI